MMKFLQFIAVFLFVLNAHSQKVFKTPSGKKYHLETCRMVKNTSAEITLEKAAQLGLGACKICGPPANAAANFAKKTASGEANTVRCHGTTQAGSRCKRMTKIANGYCFQHGPK